MEDSTVIPGELLQAVVAGTAAVFLGAGVSACSGLPSWNGLVDALRRDLPADAPAADPPMIAEYFELEHGRRRLIAVIRKHVTGGRPNRIHDALRRLDPQMIFTTNFDNIVELSYGAAGEAIAVVVSDEEVPYSYEGKRCLVKLHGSIDRPASIVVTARDFESYEDSHPAVARLLAHHLQARTILLLGYSARDPDFRQILHRLRRETGIHSQNVYMVTFEMNDLERREIESRGIRTITLGPFNPMDAEGRLSDFIVELADASAPRESITPLVRLLEGRVERTARIVAAARDFAEIARPEHDCVRLWQGYSALSLGKGDHPEDEAYSSLLAQEGEAFRALLRSGITTRLIVGRRPIFLGDLGDHSSQNVALARRLRARCERLLSLIDESERKSLPFSVACSSDANYADTCLGELVLFRGMRGNSQMGFNLTIEARSKSEISDFVDAFEATFDRLVHEGSVDGTDATSTATDNARAIARLRDSLASLDRWLMDA